MTLVVSDISRFGIVMVGDSAVTTDTGVEPGAVKVQYSATANVGFALWGDASVGDDQRLDYWLADFIRNDIEAGDSVEAVGQKLATEQNKILSKTGRSWEDMYRGIHVAGYRNGLPVLFHVHGGDLDKPKHELCLNRDYPDSKNWTEAQFRRMLQLEKPEDGFAHLRNGYHQHFAKLFDNARNYSRQLEALFGKKFPHSSLEGRFEFYKTLVRFVAGVLISSKVDRGVNDILSAIAFNDEGLVKNEILPWPTSSADSGAMARFSGTPNPR